MTMGWIALTVWLACLSASKAFLYNPQAHPNLDSLSTTLDTDQILKVRMDINLVEDSGRQQLYPSSYSHAAAAPTRLALNGPVLKLTQELPLAKNRLHMPGASSGNAQVSTGTHALDVLEPASYIGMSGLERVALEKACWEMLWLDHSDSGKLICAFDVPFPIRRNGASLDHRKENDGPLYITFNIYSQESLAAAQATKYATQARSAVYLQEKQVELLKMKATNNLIAKAVHYQRAFAAFDKLLILPHVSHIPEQKDVVEFSNGLFVTKAGVVWKKLNALFGPSSQTLGRAVLSLVETKTEDSVKDDTNDEEENPQKPSLDKLHP